MKKHIFPAALCLIVILLVTFSLSGRNNSPQGPTELLHDISADAPFVNTILLGEKADVYTDLSLRLLRESHSGKNTLIAPLSTVYGLSITANGAEGDTLTQLESAFGMSVSEMNEYLYSYTTRLGGSGNTLSFANSIWLHEGGEFTVNRDFLHTCATWYDTEIYETEFNDAALESINSWTLENTGGSIDFPLTDFRQPDGMILLGTLLFDGYWETPFSESGNRDGIFTQEDGSEVSSMYMSSIEDLYLEGETCTGFLKPYRTDDFVFAALLPREGISIEEFLSTVNGQYMSTLFDNASEATVYVTMPKFTSDVSLDMITALQALGVTDVFEHGSADLTGIGSSHLCITDIRQEAAITVDELGTRAVAAAAEAAFPASAREILEDKYVDLNRPFVYMILETTNYTPVFLGTLMTTE